MILWLAPGVTAHVLLLPENNMNIHSAAYISDPVKSWAAYSSLMPDKAQYYSFDMVKGQRIYLSLLKSTGPEDASFKPGLALIGPGLNSKGDLPGFVEVPSGLKAIAIQGYEPAHATYEPFGPSSYLEMAELDLEAPESGRYYAAVYAPSEGGNYSLTIGYLESSTLAERILAPIDLISVYKWEGQSTALMFMPMFIVLLQGIIALPRRLSLAFFSVAGSLSGLFYLGTSAGLLFQIMFNLTRAPLVPEVLISLILAAFPWVLGVASIRISRQREIGIHGRAALFAIGIAGLMAGTGMLIGPILAIAASIPPSQRRSAI
ncbi:MAG TPA: hypothetical protein VN455_04215 [Methanotrichaceae archaeon]|nr:hypothetical protein [Methanotrichaceae archaeon]